MRKTAISLSFLSAFCVGICWGQTLPKLSDEVVFSTHEVTLEEAIRAIRTQSAWTLSYLDALIPFEKVLVLPQRRLSVKRLLAHMLKDEALTYRVQQTSILLLSDRKRSVFLKGYVRKENTNIPLVGATVYVPALGSGAVTNNPHGYYALELPVGVYAVHVRYLGYIPRIDTLRLSADSFQSFDMAPEVKTLPSLIVAHDSIAARLYSLHLGHRRFTPSTLGPLPYYLGEEDVLQALVLLPGVNNLLEGSAGGLSVRGGAPDQNGIFLDQVPLLSANHFLGLISVFDPNFVESIDIYKSSAPPIYNNSTSAVIGVQQKEGSYERVKGSVGLGLATVRGHLEGPLKKQKSSFFVSGRHSSLLGRNIRSGWTFVDRLLRVSANGSTSDFFDLHAKLSYLGDRHQWYLSGYWGRDRNFLRDFSEEKWGNRALSLRWSTRFSGRAFLNSYLTYSEYQHVNSDIGTTLTYIGESRTNTYTFKSHLGVLFDDLWELDLGLQGHFLHIKSGDFQQVLTDESTSSQSQVVLSEENGIETNLYASLGKDFFSRLMAKATLRLNTFFTLGPRIVDQYAAGKPFEDRYVVGTETYAFPEVVDTHVALEPRLFLNFRIDTRTALKFNYSRAHQHLRQIYNTLIPVPSSVWKLTAPYIPPLRVDQFSLGVFKDYPSYGMNVSLELYYKEISNILEYKSSFSPLFENRLENRLVYNEGQAYGGELSFSMRWHAWKGWLNYDLSRVHQRETPPAGGAESQAVRDYVLSNYDRTHQLSFGNLYFFSKRFFVSSKFVLATGRPYIQPTGQYTYEDRLIPDFVAGSRARLPMYHRLDVSLSYTRRLTLKRLHMQSVWNLTLYNVYAHRNVHAYLFRQRDDAARLDAEPLYLLDGILPSITYRLTF